MMINVWCQWVMQPCRTPGLIYRSSVALVTCHHGEVTGDQKHHITGKNSSRQLKTIDSFYFVLERTGQVQLISLTELLHSVSSLSLSHSLFISLSYSLSLSLSFSLYLTLSLSLSFSLFLSFSHSLFSFFQLHILSQTLPLFPSPFLYLGSIYTTLFL